MATPRKADKLLLINVMGTLLKTKKSSQVYPTTVNDLEIIPEAATTIVEYITKGWQCTTYSNQAGVEEGYLSLDNCVEIMKFVNNTFPVSSTYFCTDYAGKLCYRYINNRYYKEVKYPKSYRYPRPGMFYAAIERYAKQQADLIIVGDSPDCEEGALVTKKEYPRVKFLYADEWFATVDINVQI